METQQNSQEFQSDGSERPKELTAGKNKWLMAALAYVGPLIIISYIVAREDSFVKFHIKQALVLFTVEAVIWLYSIMMLPFYSLVGFINLAVFVLAIIGIIRAVNGEEKELPFVGKFAKYFPI